MQVRVQFAKKSVVNWTLIVRPINFEVEEMR